MGLRRLGRFESGGSEVADPQRNFPRALVGGVCFVAIVYLLFSAACLKVLPFEKVAASSTLLPTWSSM